jgi:hypothetical protein
MPLAIVALELDDICQLISRDGLAIKNPPTPLFLDVPHGVIIFFVECSDAHGHLGQGLVL